VQDTWPLHSSGVISLCSLSTCLACLPPFPSPKREGAQARARSWEIPIQISQHLLYRDHHSSHLLRAYYVPGTSALPKFLMSSPHALSLILPTFAPVWIIAGTAWLPPWFYPGKLQSPPYWTAGQNLWKCQHNPSSAHRSHLPQIKAKLFSLPLRPHDLWSHLPGISLPDPSTVGSSTPRTFLPFLGLCTYGSQGLGCPLDVRKAHSLHPAGLSTGESLSEVFPVHLYSYILTIWPRSSLLSVWLIFLSLTLPDTFPIFYLPCSLAASTMSILYGYYGVLCQILSSQDTDRDINTYCVKG
jgi:hypothetical protein